MGLREGWFFLIVLIISLTYADARNLIVLDDTGTPIDYKMPIEIETSELVGRNEELCAECVEFTDRATYYLENNKTQDEIIGTFHQACSQMGSFKTQCTMLVDLYASLFFVEIGKIHPEEFCGKVGLCENTKYLSLPKKEDTCTLCHRVVDEVLVKLKDPDTQFGIIQILRKECEKMGSYAHECKTLVLLYGPLILANGEKFLEKTDVCASIHACQRSQLKSLSDA